MLFSADFARLTLVAESVLLFLQVCLAFTSVRLNPLFFSLDSILLIFPLSVPHSVHPASVLAAALRPRALQEHAGLCHGSYRPPHGLPRPPF